jgi:hypothetical protein
VQGLYSWDDHDDHIPAEEDALLYIMFKDVEKERGVPPRSYRVLWCDVIGEYSRDIYSRVVTVVNLDLR